MMKFYAQYRNHTGIAIHVWARTQSYRCIITEKVHLVNHFFHDFPGNCAEAGNCRCRRHLQFLPPLFIGEVARWIRAKPEAAGSEGSCPPCSARWAFLRFALQIAGLPPALRATPLINAGGKIFLSPMGRMMPQIVRNCVSVENGTPTIRLLTNGFGGCIVYLFNSAAGPQKEVLLC